MRVLLGGSGWTRAREQWFQRVRMCVEDEELLEELDALEEGYGLVLEMSEEEFLGWWEQMKSVPGWGAWPIWALLENESEETAPAENA